MNEKEFLDLIRRQLAAAEMDPNNPLWDEIQRLTKAILAGEDDVLELPDED
jgi:hypothetical protein